MNYNPVIVTNMSLDGQATQIGYTLVLTSESQEVNFLRLNTIRNPPFIAQGAYIYNPNPSPVTIKESVTMQMWTVEGNSAATLNFAGAPSQKFTFSGSGTVYVGFTNFPQLANSFYSFSSGGSGSGSDGAPSDVSISNTSLTPDLYSIAAGATSAAISSSIVNKIVVAISPLAELATVGTVLISLMDGTNPVLQWEAYIGVTASNVPTEFEYTWPAGKEYVQTSGTLSVTLSQALKAGTIRITIL